MALSEVWAEINSNLYRMTQTSDGVWSVEGLNLSIDGGYVCAFWATDDAGNTSYRTAVLWVVDGRMVCLRFIDNPFTVVEIKSDTSVVNVSSDFSVLHIGSSISTILRKSAYTVRYKGVCCI